MNDPRWRRMGQAASALGNLVYVQYCLKCHGAQLEGGSGAPLAGPTFGRSLATGKMTTAGLDGFIRGGMPVDAPGSLSEAQYQDVLAFILSKNGYAPGSTELTAARTARIALLPYPNLAPNPAPASGPTAAASRRFRAARTSSSTMRCCGTQRTIPRKRRLGVVAAGVLTARARGLRARDQPAHGFHHLEDRREPGLHPAGGLVFAGEGDGSFDAFDARTGAKVWTDHFAGGANAPPISYAVDETQYVAVAAGGSFQFGFKRGDAVGIFRLKR